MKAATKTVGLQSRQLGDLRRWISFTAAYGVSSAGNFVGALFVARAYGPAGFGRISVLQAAGFLAAGCGAGIDSAAARTLAASGGEGADEPRHPSVGFTSDPVSIGKRELLQSAGRLRLGATTAAIFFGVALSGPRNGFEVAAVAAWAASLSALGFNSISPTADGDSKGFARLQSVWAVTMLAPGVASPWVSLHAYLLLSIVLACAFCAWSARVAAADGVFADSRRTRVTAGGMVAFRRMCLASAAGATLFVLFDRMDLFLVQRWFDARAVGEYAAAARLAQGLVVLTTGAQLAVTRSLRHLRGNSAEYRRTAMRVAVLCGGAALLGAVVLSVSAPVVFGGQYKVSAGLVLPLSLQYVIGALSIPFILPLSVVARARAFLVLAAVAPFAKAAWMFGVGRRSPSLAALGSAVGGIAGAGTTALVTGRAVFRGDAPAKVTRGAAE